VAQDKEMWQAVVNTVPNVRVLKTAQFVNYLKTKHCLTHSLPKWTIVNLISHA
jgi:hypothetical protein